MRLMGRLWGVLWGVVAILGSACADLPDNNALRTPNGVLWAGTTFRLRAMATANGNLVAQSDPAQVQVGQVVRWRWQVESPNGISVPQGTEAVFQVRLINDGNGWDSLTFTLEREELENRRNWTIELRETQRWGRLVLDNLGNGGAGSVISPGGEQLYFVCTRTPGWDAPTDGVWLRLAARATGATQAQVLGEFVAGVRRDEWVRTRAWSYGDHTNFVPATLYQGRLFWMGTDASGNTIIFRTRDAVEATQGSGVGNERIAYGRLLRNFRPMGFSVVLGNGWFTGLGSQLIRIDLLRVIANDTSSDPYTVVVFPSGVLPRLDLAPLAVSGRLYVAGSDRRLHAISPDGVRVGQSAPMPASYGAFSTNLVQIGRVFYIGTNQGWVVQFDALTGVLRTARRVSMQPIHSLAPTLMGRGLLVRAGARELYALHPSQMNTLWRRAFTEDLVSPVVASSQSEVGAVVDKQGRLFVFHTRAGFNMPLYPQPIFGEQQLSSASVAIVRRAGRAVGYVYVLGQLARAESNPQALLRIVTLENPLNRLEYGESTLHVGSRYHPALLLTGTGQGSYCLLTSLRAESYGGTVAGIPLR
jgi:outer membrane protein assembly factor BamB